MVLDNVDVVVNIIVGVVVVVVGDVAAIMVVAVEVSFLVVAASGDVVRFPHRFIGRCHQECLRYWCRDDCYRFCYYLPLQHQHLVI